LGGAMAGHLIDIYDQLLELYELRDEAERRRDSATLEVVTAEIRKLEDIAAALRAREDGSLH
jgi:hypothetical protein